jgi:microcystin-dependent protein
MQFAGASVPAGWLLCDGTAVSRTTYSSLFTAIGTAYGAGNGSTTFNVPNLKARVPVGRDSSVTIFNTLNNQGGATTRTIAVANLPAHNHGLNSHTHTISHGHSASGTGSDHSHTASSGSDGSHTHSLSTGAVASPGALNSLFLNSGNPPVQNAGNTQSGGSHNHTITVGTDTSHSHSITVGSASVSVSVTVGASNTANSGAATGNTGDTGSGTALETMPPYIVVNYIIKV